MLTTILPSHASNGAAEATWPQRDVDVKSCWRRCCRVKLVTVLPSHAGDDAAEATCLRRDVDV
jgi:hypothetical protein